MNLSTYIFQAESGHPIQRTQMKFPRWFYLGSCFQTRVTPEPFVKDLSPSAQRTWQMSFSRGTHRTSK